VADARYASWIRQQPCALCLGPGPCHAHHHTEGLTYDPETERPRKALGGKRGKSQKADDVFLMPLHLRCHKHVHEFTGPCSDWSQEKRRTWQDDQVKQHRHRYAMQCPEPAARPGRTIRKLSDAEGKRAFLGIDVAHESAAERERGRIVSWLRDKAGARHLKVNEAAVLTDAASELEQQTGEF